MPWAFAIARRLVIDLVRRERRAPQIAVRSGADVVNFVDLASEDDHAVEDHELERLFACALARLPEAQRVVFELLKRDGLTLAEVAQVLGVTVTAVKLRAHRAYVALRTALGDHAVALAGVQP
jgi:RNA polymerase sigma-70 factor (ECF subfamily)